MDKVKQGKPFEDIFYEMYELNLNAKLGQFLTPPKLSSSVINMIKPEGMMFSDICCGGGALTLAYARSIKNHEEATLVLNDLDERMIKMTVVQLLINCLVHGIKFKEICAYHSNAITEYDDDKDHVMCIFRS